MLKGHRHLLCFHDPTVAELTVFLSPDLLESPLPILIKGFSMSSNSKDSSQESASYAALGASSAKAGVLKAVGETDGARYFASPLPDVAGDPESAFFLHADGAGTKSIIAYLAFRESGSVLPFRYLAYDSMAMNLDDVACSGGVEGLFLSNTIGRNRAVIPDSAVAEIVTGYREYTEILATEGISVQLGGGETADMSDLVRTVVVDSTLCARIPRSQLVDTWRVTPGDVIVGFSSTGKSRYETQANSGIGSNGLTLARHVMLNSEYVIKYPEIVDPALSKDLAYRGSFKLSDTPAGLGMSVGEALLSPTRSYTPLIKVLLATLGDKIHSLIHCTGGGQAKAKRFGRGVRYEKNNLFPTPPIFSLIQSHGNIPWEEMYAVFNMGHRLEACVDPASVPQVIALGEQFGIAAQVVGRVTSSDTGNEVVISSPHGVFRYS